MLANELKQFKMRRQQVRLNNKMVVFGGGLLRGSSKRVESAGRRANRAPRRVKFLVDEDVAVEVARCLQQAGHEVALVAEVLGVRTDDVDIWHHAVRAEFIVVTCNRQDFLELAGTAPETASSLSTADGRGRPSAGMCCSLSGARARMG